MKELLTKPMGGEAEVGQDQLYYAITDTGRSSLRLILESGLKDKKFLIPDYLCEVILNILKEFKVAYEFYRVNEDLSSDLKEIKDKKFDVLYVINYFGQRNALLDKVSADKIVIEDNVFSPVVEKNNRIKQWIGFNSLRKISFLADGSLLCSTLPLKPDAVFDQTPPFSVLKYKAKGMKFDYLNKGSYSEEDYVKIFKEAEGMLDRQVEIYNASKQSIFHLLDLYRRLEKENDIKKKNRAVLDKYLRGYKIKLNPEYLSYYVLSVDRRDGLRKFLTEHKVFLAVHWPRIEGIKNNLYERVISIPMDSRYQKSDMERVAKLILKFLKAAPKKTGKLALAKG